MKFMHKEIPNSFQKFGSRKIQILRRKMGGSHLIFFRGWVGFQKYYVIFRVGHGKCLRLITRWVGGVKKGPKYAYVIFEWSLTEEFSSNLAIDYY